MTGDVVHENHLYSEQCEGPVLRTTPAYCLSYPSIVVILSCAYVFIIIQLEEMAPTTDCAFDNRIKDDVNSSI